MRVRALLGVAVAMLLAASVGAGERRLVVKGVVQAPPSEVWRLFTTSEGITSWMVPEGTVDLRLGGELRTSYQKGADLRGPQAIVNEILAYDPGRMIAIRNTKAPAGFPFADRFAQTWTVIYFRPTADGGTEVEVDGLGYGDDAASDWLYAHFAWGNRVTLEAVQEHVKPGETLPPEGPFEPPPTPPSTDR